MCQYIASFLRIFHGEICAFYIEKYTMAEYNFNDSIVGAMDSILHRLVELGKEFAEMHEEQKAIHKEIKIVSSKVSGDYTPPNQRKSANERRVQEVINKYWELIKNGTLEREALAIACRSVENAHGLGGYKSLESLRTATYREIDKNRHSLSESEEGLAFN